MLQHGCPGHLHRRPPCRRPGLVQSRQSGRVWHRLSTLSPALTRAVAKGKLAIPRHGFYHFVRPEQRAAGTADPAEWIDPLMKHQDLGYRVSLLRAAAHHGSSHPSAMIFQVVAPRQLRDLTLGAHRLQFIYQEPEAFAACNEAALVGAIKTPSSPASSGPCSTGCATCTEPVASAAWHRSPKTLAHALIRAR